MNEKGTRIVADLNWFGHIPTYHPLYLRAFLDLDYNVVSFSPSPNEIHSNPYLRNPLNTGRLTVASPTNAYASPPARRFSWLLSLPGGNKFWNYLRHSEFIRQLRARRRWLALMAAIAPLAAESPSRTKVFLPYLNDLLHIPRPTDSLKIRWAGLYLNSSQLRRPPSRETIGSLRIFQSPKLDYLAVLDEGSVSLIQPYCNNKPVGTLPDLTNEDSALVPTDLSRRISALAAGRPIIALLGHLTPRKGIGRLCDLAKLADPSRLFFLFAGELEPFQVDEETRLFLKEAAAGRHAGSYAHLERLPNEIDFNSLVKISSVIYARYEGFFASSNLLTKAAVFRKPVIVSSIGCMAERVVRYQTGMVFAGGDEFTELKAIESLIGNAASIPAERYAEYHRAHSYDALVAGLRNLEEASLL
jgi:hypothetical protein